jgi:hypothetical protein
MSHKFIKFILKVDEPLDDNGVVLLQLREE